jgi:hypothetical protein
VFRNTKKRGFHLKIAVVKPLVKRRDSGNVRVTRREAGLPTNSCSIPGISSLLQLVLTGPEIHPMSHIKGNGKCFHGSTSSRT